MPIPALPVLPGPPTIPILISDYTIPLQEGGGTLRIHVPIPTQAGGVPCLLACMSSQLSHPYIHYSSILASNGQPISTFSPPVRAPFRIAGFIGTRHHSTVVTLYTTNTAFSSIFCSCHSPYYLPTIPSPAWPLYCLVSSIPIILLLVTAGRLPALLLRPTAVPDCALCHNLPAITALSS